VTRKGASRILVLTIGGVSVMMLLAVVAAPVQAGWCAFGTKVSWPKGVPPDYNGNGKVCKYTRGDFPNYIDDSTGRKP